ncbi:hemerythrin domain-containing protein [Staphylospora marina]|uniref:hemerythrin domain-containing protein n=1 Tax=Staphylospora marina TaxID=2490858 RepID=UPI000F5BA8DA|nr:hemerythrin domain-containing protein [Staphylospora marina]
MPFHCSHMMGGNVSLCPALKQLKQEHTPLREQLEQLYRAAREIGEESRIEDWRDALVELKEKAILFEQDLEPHSEREEGVLFPMMAQYIGRESGPIAVMEDEHEQGKKYLQSFIAKIDQATAPVTSEKAKEIGSFMMEAYRILFHHFIKEENVLFPMAERLLSPEEKELLAKQLQAD